jgi:protein-L-isoaspartate(D-aspartate) O-methyltransferase
MASGEAGAIHYQAAVLAKLCDKVYTIEIVEPLGKQAEARLARLGYENVEVRIGDGYYGWPEEGTCPEFCV